MSLIAIVFILLNINEDLSLHMLWAVFSDGKKKAPSSGEWEGGPKKGINTTFL